MKQFLFTIHCVTSSVGILIKELLVQTGGLTDQVLSNELVNFLEIGAADGFINKNYILSHGYSRGQYFLDFP